MSAKKTRIVHAILPVEKDLSTTSNLFSPDDKIAETPFILNEFAGMDG
jgi:hypothetical protein